MDFIQKVVDFIGDALLAEFVVVVAGYLSAQFIQSRYLKWKYGGWRVIVHKDGQQVVNREISASKAKIIQDESADLSVFLKGVASPYGIIHCDLLDKGKEIGMLTEDREGRRYILDLDKNPLKEIDRDGVRL